MDNLGHHRMARRDAHLATEVYTKRWASLTVSEGKQVKKMLDSVENWNVSAYTSRLVKIGI